MRRILVECLGQTYNKIEYALLRVAGEGGLELYGSLDKRQWLYFLRGWTLHGKTPRGGNKGNFS
jgi:hypothetical protein